MSDSKINIDQGSFRKKDDDRHLSNKDREEFRSVFDEINELINMNLDETGSVDLVDSVDSPEGKSMDDEKPDQALKNDPLALNDQANRQAEQLRQKLLRLGIKKDDPTGKQLKASGDS